MKMIGFTEKGLEGVARFIKSYADEGVGYHNALGRYTISADLILNDAEYAAIKATYRRLYGEPK